VGARRDEVMLLFKKRFHEGLVTGAVTLTFRRWEKPHVRVGGRYRCHPIGVLEVDRVERVPVSTITIEDAVRAGFLDREELLGYLKSAREGPLEPDVYRVELHWGGDGDRVPIALDAELSKEDVAAITAKLEKLGPWTKKTLAVIEENPRVAASQLAKKVKRETAPFKADVVKLKKLGLTQSFEVGYELSPRGRAYLAARRRKRID
jgi:hypothetical protein